MGRWRAAQPTGGWSGGRAAPCAARGAQPGRPPTRCSVISPRLVSTARRGCWPPTRPPRRWSYIDGSAAVPPLPEGHAHRAGPDQRGAPAAPLPPGGGLVRPRPGTAGRGRFRPASPGSWSATTTCTRPTWSSRRARAVALIDFDLAGPGSPAWDLAAAARHWSPALRRAGRAATRGRARRCAGSGCCWTPTGCPPPGGARWPRRSWPIKTGAAPSSPTRRGGHPGFIDYWQQVAGPMTRARHCVGDSPARPAGRNPLTPEPPNPPNVINRYLVL